MNCRQKRQVGFAREVPEDLVPREMDTRLPPQAQSAGVEAAQVAPGRGLDTTRLTKLQAAMKTWLDHLHRAHEMNQVSEDKYKLTRVLFGNIQEQLEDSPQWRSFWEGLNSREFLLLALFAGDLYTCESTVNYINSSLNTINSSGDPDETIAILNQLKQQLQPLMRYEDSMGNTLENPHVRSSPELHELFRQKLNECLEKKMKMEKLFAKLMGESTRKAQGKRKVDEGPPSAAPEIVELEVEPARLPKRRDIYLNELDQCVSDIRSNMVTITGRLKEGVPKLNYNIIVQNLDSAQSSIDMVKHLQLLLSEESPLGDAKLKELRDLEAEYEQVTEKGREYIQQFRAGGPSRDEVTCPLCSPEQRNNWDNSVWRLEAWLNYAEITLEEVMGNRPPSVLEDLQNAILNHKELLLDIDSHCSLVQALKKVSVHLDEHELNELSFEQVADFQKLKANLTTNIDRWDVVCQGAGFWQKRLQTTLLKNPDFHLTVDEYEEMVTQAQDKVQELEPVDFSHGDDESIQRKLRILKELGEELSEEEPELRTLKETAEQLFVNPKTVGMGTPEETEEPNTVIVTPDSEQKIGRISGLFQNLNFLTRVTGAYVKYLTNYTSGDGRNVD